MSMLRFDRVSVQFGYGRAALTAVDAVTLEVPAGTVVGLVGESGSGKSTLARAAVGLVPLAGGEITLDGASLAARMRGRRPVQMVFQDPYSSLNPRMTIGASIAEALPRGRSRAGEVRRLLELVGLSADRTGDYPSALSGGQRQRVALARALATRPPVVIADEITSSLDGSVQGTVLNLVRDLQRALGMAVLFISHNLAVVRYVSDLIAVMYLGRIVELGPAEEVLRDPRHPYTRSLLEAVPRIGSSLDGGAGYAETEPPDPHRPPTGCRFHPRCPVGPLVHADRDICLDTDPRAEAPLRPHRAECHFAAAPEPLRSRA
ncbi:MAG: ATP-binding cassette domain-containing protein [Micromonosporaceae bacterium]|nr:ATP-binding cassette domain-containing protein [Micromonosporaceae bacterium]